MTKPRANGVDLHVAERLGALLEVQGMTMTKLADEIGTTYQQVHKYRHGKNRISAGRLHAISQALGVTPDWFFKGIEG